MTLEWLLGIPVGLFLLYLVARFIFAAYYQSRLDFENRKERENHGKK